MSQERFADVIGTTRRHMIRLENGEHLPSVALRDRIAEATGETRDKFQAADDDEESSAVPLSTGEFAMLGDLMARLGASLTRAATA